MSDTPHHESPLTPTPTPPVSDDAHPTHGPAPARSHGHAHAHAHDHGPIDPDLAESREGVRVLLISFVVLGLTTVAQIIIVLLTGSVALLGDTVHNFGDALTALPLAAAFILSRRPPSKRFNYGLGRTEDLAGLMIVGLIGFSGAFTLYASIRRLLEPEPLQYVTAGILAGLVGFVGNEVVALYRIRQGRKMDSAALIADGKHARVDGLLSLSVTGALLLYMAGFEQADALTGIGISLVIARITWNSGRDVGLRMLDGIAASDHDDIRNAALTVIPEGRLADVRARWLGHVIHVDIVVRGGVDESWLEPVDAAIRDASSRVRAVHVTVDSSRSLAAARS